MTTPTLPELDALVAEKVMGGSFKNAHLITLPLEVHA